MLKLGINQENVKISNRQNLLRLLNDKGAMSRKDIAQKMHLTSAAVTQICNELIDIGEIVECGTIENNGRVGRKKVLIDINSSYKYICSIVIEKYNSFVTVTDIKANVLDSVGIDTDKTIEPIFFIEKLKDIMMTMLEKYDISHKDLLGIGVSVLGAVDKENGISKHAYGVWDKPVAIKDILKKYIDVEIIVENNISSFAQAEIVYGMGRRYNSLLFVRWHPGIGGAFIIDGKIHKDKNGKTTELGHIIIENSNKKCKCGKVGCLETIVSSVSLLEQIKAIYSQQATPKLYELTRGNIEKIIEVIEAEFLKDDLILDDEVFKILNNAIKLVAKTVVNTITLMAPDKVVLWGKYFRNKYILQYFYKSCANYEVGCDAMKVIKSNLDLKSSYIGGVAIVFDDVFMNMKN